MTALPAPTASGTLDRRPLVHLFVYVLERGLSGTIELGPTEGEATLVVFAQGVPIKEGAKSAAPRSDAPLADRIDALFALPLTTSFAYYDGYDGLPGCEPTPVSALRVIWRGLVRNPPTTHFEAALQRARAGRLRLLPGGQESIEGELGRDAGRLVELLAGEPKPISVLLDGVGVPAPILELMIYALLVLKRVDIVAATSTTAVSMPPASAPAVTPPAPNPASSEIPEPPPSSGSVREATPVARVRLKKPMGPPGAIAEERAAVSRNDPRVSANFDPSAVDTALKARRNEILARVKAIEEEDYFQMLGVSREATTTEVQSAFIALAKSWHPDRLPPPLADVRDACSKVFARMSEAQATLIDAERRGQYMRLLAEGGATPKDQDEIADIVEAATAFQKAEIQLRRSQLVEAEELARRAAQLDPQQSDYQALLAWLEAIKPENQSPEATRVRVAMLAKAIDQNPRCERAFFYRAMLYKRLKEDKAALADFRVSAELNPRNVDAQREVRLYEMRSSAGAKSDSAKPGRSKEPEATPNKGLFGRLFKK